MHPRYNIHALHGFLGNPKDWSFIRQDLDHHFQCHNFFKDTSILPFPDWAEEFNQKAHSINSLPNKILMGYSLGGRLALHALLQNPRQWRAAILMSTHPGLKTHEDKIARIASDEIWAIRFENEPWENLLKAWNAQAVFKHDSLPLQRNESENDRHKLAAALRTWSLGAQHDLTNDLASLDMPILWMVGENDTKFLGIAQELKFRHRQSRTCIVANAGHRLLFEHTETHKQNVTEFIKNL